MKKCKKIYRSLVVLSAVAAVLFTVFATDGAMAQARGKGKPAKGSAAVTPPPAGKPGLEYNKYRQQVEQGAIQLNDQQIADMKKLLELKPSEQELPDIYFRIAEAYWTKSQYYWFQGMEITIDASALEKKDPKALADKKKQQALFDESDKWRKEAIAYYEQILKKFQGYKRYDEVIFFLGFNYWEMGKQEKSLTIYRELVKNFPNSQFIPEVYLAFGEYYFAHGELDKALTAYGKVLEHQESKIYGYALYKTAWVYYNLGEWQSALDKFKECITHADTSQAGERDEGRIALKREALKDYVLTYSQTGDFEHALDNFKEVGGSENYFNMTTSLANLYFDQGKDKESIYVYNVLIKEDEQKARVLQYQARIIQAARRIGNKPFVIEQIGKQIEQLKVFRANPPQEKVEVDTVATAEKETEETLQRIAAEYHDEAKRTNKKETFEYARDVYALYLQAYPKTEKSYDTRFFYAELLYKLNDYEEAANQYQLVFKQNPKGKHTPDCLYNRVLAYEILAKDELKKQTKGLKKKGLEPVEFPENVKKLHDAALDYVENLPEGERVVKCKYIVANVNYLYNHFDVANRLFAAIALKHPETDEAEKSMNLFLDTFNLVEDWRSLNKYARQFYANKKLVGANKKREDDLKKIIEESAFKMVEPVEKSGDFAEAAKMYAAFVKEFPQSKLADVALYNASVNMDKSGQIEEAITLRENLVKDYPKSSLVQKCKYLNILAYENMAEFEKAAEQSEDYIKVYSKDPKNIDLVYNAAIYRESLSQYDQAVANYEQFIKMSKKKEDICPVYWLEAKLFNRLKTYDKAVASYKKYLSTCSSLSADRVLSAKLYIANDIKRKGDLKNANKEYENILKEFIKYRDKKEPLDQGGTAAAAEAKFNLAEVVYEKYAALKIEGGEKKLAETFKKKLEAFQTTANEYKQIVDFKVGDWAVASLYRIGTIGENFVETLRNSPRPANQTKEQLFLYNELLEQDYIKPVEADTVNYFGEALKAAQEFNTYTEWTLKTKEKLMKYKSADYPETAEYWGKPEFASEVMTPMPYIEKLIEDQPKAEKKYYEEKETEDEFKAEMKKRMEDNKAEDTPKKEGEEGAESAPEGGGDQPAKPESKKPEPKKGGAKKRGR